MGAGYDARWEAFGGVDDVVCIFAGGDSAESSRLGIRISDREGG